MLSKFENIFFTSVQTNALIVLLFFLTCTFFSAIIPPRQSPDEHDHLKRAYLLSKGVIVLDHPEGRLSGGMIDSGLLDYIDAYSLISTKLAAETVDSADGIKWTGVKAFSEAPGTGFYFPLIYAPQAVGLAIGEKLELTIDSSYRLTRLITLLAVCGIIFSAFCIFPANPLVLALIIIPMSIFQFSSPTLDGVSTALSIFSIAAFMRIARDKEKVSLGVFYFLSVSVVLLATSRAHLLPMLAFVLIPCFYFKDKKHYFVFVFSLLFVLAWSFFAIKTTATHRLDPGAPPPSSLALFYVSHPMGFVRVLWATLFDQVSADYYYSSFFGNLGWLDTRFRSEVYNYLFLCIAMVGSLSISIRGVKADWAPRVLLVGLAFSSVLLIFFSLLVAWSPHPASLISGVQGRYFLIPVIMFAYAISGDLKLNEGILRKIALVLCAILLMFTISGTTKLLLERYYLAPEQAKKANLLMRPSAQLDKANPVKLVMSDGHKTALVALGGIFVQFGTYVRKNPGMAELSLTASDGHKLKIPFDLSELADNEYKYFKLDSLPYVSGEIVSLTGGGVSVWEVHDDEGGGGSCLIYEYANGSRRYTPGCSKK